MDDLLNEAGNGSEDTGASTEKPVSIRDSLKAALDNAESGAGASGTADRQRDEGGRFAPKESNQGNAAQAAQQPAAAAAPKAGETAPTDQAKPAAVAAVGETGATTKAPPGWSNEAKAQFGTLPPEVQAAVVKREQEIDNGFRVLQDYKGLEEFTPAIKQGNTTHAEVMRRALDYEKALQSNPIGTVMHVARIGGIDIRSLARAIVDGKVQLPEQPAPQQQIRQQPQPADVEAQVEQVLRKRDTLSQVEQFLSDPANTHAEAVLDDMIALISAGRAPSLKDAYDAACWMRPDIRQQLISQTAQAAPAQNQNTQKAAAADQARRASRSITGSSAPGPTRDAGQGQPTSIRDSLRSAMASQRGLV